MILCVCERSVMCESCKKNEATYHGADPFASDVNGDDAHTDLCSECYKAHLEDI